METGRRIGTMLSEINVVPLVDIMLVLLIIFMVTAPMLQMGIDVDLPETSAKEIPGQEERLIISLTKDRKIFINKYRVKQKELKARLRRILQRRMNREIFLRADKTLPYGYVIQVISDIKEAGVQKLGMVTEPLEMQR